MLNIFKRLKNTCACFIVCAGCLSGFNVKAQDSLSLNEAILITLEKNFSIRIFQKDAEFFENDNTLGNAGFLPVLDATFFQDNSRLNTKTEFLTGEEINKNNAKSNSFNAGAIFTWTLFDGLKMFASRSRQNELEHMSQTQVEVAAENNVALLMAAYFNLVRQYQALAVLNENFELSSERKRIAEDRYNIGSGSKMEFMLAEVDFNSDRSLVLEQQALIDRLEVNMNQIMGRDPAIEYRVTDTIELLPKLNLEQLLIDLENQNPNLVVAQSAIEVSRYDLKEMQSDRYPQFNVFANYNYLGSNSESGFLTSNRIDGFTYGITLSLRIFDGFNINRRITNARINIERSQLEFQELDNQLKTNLIADFKTYENNLVLLELETENQVVARENQQLAIRSYELGNISAIAFRESQRNYLQSVDRYLTSLFRVKLSEIDLLRLSSRILD